MVCPLTTDVQDDVRQIRIDVIPSARNGLRKKSQISIDKINVLLVSKVGQIIGEADAELMSRVSRALAVFLGIV